MGALSYLFFTKQKNLFKECLRSPKKLILPLFLILVFIIDVCLDMTSSPSGSYRSIDEFLSVVLLVYTLLFVDISKNGFSNGASFFSMADINLVFVSPVKTAKTLFYGIIQQLGRSVYMGIFILLQYSVSREYYGIGPWVIVAVALGYGVTAFLSQMCSMLIYILTSSSDKKVRTGKIIYYGIIAFFLLFVIIKGEAVTSFSFAKITEVLGSEVMHFMPVSGIVSFLVGGIVKNSFSGIAFGVLGIFVSFALLYLLISKVKSDYYEDVVRSTEITYSAITSSKESVTYEGLARNIKTGKTGFTKGEGAFAVSEKHKIENRRGKLLFFNRMSLVSIGMTVVYSLMAQGDCLIAFVLSLFSLTMTVSAGRWLKELTFPYIYLIPEKPFKKLICAMKEQIPAIVFESVVLFAILHFILDVTVAETVAMAVARIGFGFLFMGANLLMLKITGKRVKGIFTVIVYTLLCLVCSVPAAFAGFYVSMFFWAYPFVAYLVTVPVNVLVFMLLLYVCRNILENTEFIQ